MKRIQTLRLLMLTGALIAALTLAAAPTATAQSGGNYDLTWNTLDAGGGQSSGGAYTLTGTIGQADAGGQSGGSYTVGSGFWVSLIAYLQQIFLPLAER